MAIQDGIESGLKAVAALAVGRDSVMPELNAKAAH
jgi:hypothetical protein